ncbi:DUF948 domain-containing protein [Thalassorhabdus alkalitolerans]|uniref:DUF948 domain-containing protein n=1 Tax=Thalassorhabdus alkalitolerans TaxID=2282697 RepID=A0ABW0YMC4_9BACI|nr:MULTISPECIES: DUF948 domain-containing protein [Bacillaceae]
MDLLGIGVLVFAIAFLILVIFLIKALNSLTKVLGGVEETVGKLPDQMDEISKQTEVILHNSNETILDLNQKMDDLNPIFHIVRDTGEASQRLSSSLVDITNSFKKDSTEGSSKVKEKNMGGLYGALALTYFLAQKRKTLKDEFQQQGAGNP